MAATLANPQAAAQWLRARVRGTLRADSRKLQPGDGFIAWPGQATDARRYVRSALAAGAAACLVEHEGLAAFDLPDDERIAAMIGLKCASGAVAALFFDDPAAALDVLAVTGTNGKSSTAWWTAQALSALGRRCGIVGTLGIGEPNAVTATGLTTPDPVTLQGALREMVDAGFAACAIEASSIGIAEQRLSGLQVRVAQFTNFTRDHLDYHGDMTAYWACKRVLFDAPGLRAAVLNIDDAQGAALAAELVRNPSARPLDLWTVSSRCEQAVAPGASPLNDHSHARPTARLAAQNIHYVDAGLAFDVVEGQATLAVRSNLIGDFNASNLLVVLGGLRALGVELIDAVRAVPMLTPVPGRMQPVGDFTLPQPAVVVDYAHTPDALEKALDALRPLADSRAGRLWCVFGCGGDRDASKRPLMGAIAQRLADAVVVTSDNPRGEAPEAILAQIAAGMSAERPQRATSAGNDRALTHEVIADRHQAIEWALQHAAAIDVVLIAGKGHETTQEVAGVKRPFSDVEVATSALRVRGVTC